jgi:TolB protein
MLVGQVPFRGTTPHAVLHDVIYEAPPPPRRINPNISSGLEAVVLRAIAKRPEQRFQRGAELTRALRQATAGGRPVAPPPVAGTATALPRRGAPPPPDRPERRRGASPLPWILAGIAGVLVLLIVAILIIAGGRGGDGDETPAPPPTAVAQATAVATATLAGDTTAPPSDMPTNTPPPADTPLPTDTPAPDVPTDTPPPPTDTAPAPTDTPPPPTDTLPPPTQPPAAYLGRLAFSSNRHGGPEIYVVDLGAGGTPQRLTNNSANDWLPDWSPDGTRIVFTSERSGNYDSWVMNADGGNPSAWVATAAWDEYPRWAPDGQRISFSSTARTGGVDNSEIFVRQANGSLTRVTQTQAENQWADWSPDGRLAYTEGYQGDSNWDIYLSNADGSNRTLWLGGPGRDVQPTWSPDGARIAFLRLAYDTNGNGIIDFEDAGDVWVGQAGGGGLRQLTSGLWAATPAWSPDGNWIAFAHLRDPNNSGQADPNEPVEILAVPVNGGDPVPLLTGPYRDGNPTWTW